MRKIYLNATATHALSLVDGDRTLEAIIARFAQDYNIPIDRARKDVQGLFESLSSIGWLTCDPERGVGIKDEEISPPLDSLSLALTHRCNLRCPYCYIPLEERADHELTTEEWKSVIQQLPPFKLMEVILTGGEPLLRDDLKEIVGAINAVNVNVVICTNGLFIDEAFVEWARSASISSLVIGIDGVAPKTHETLRGKGTFERVWEGIKLARKNDLPVQLIYTVTRLNFKEFEQAARMAYKLGIPISINEYLPLGPSREHRSDFELSMEQLFRLRARIATLALSGIVSSGTDEEVVFRHHVDTKKGAKVSPLHKEFHRKYNCLGREVGAHILPNGDVLLCPMLNWPDLVGGNVRSLALREIWETSPVFARMRQLTVDNYTVCSSCTNRYLCGGTCRAIVRANTGSLQGAPDRHRCIWNQLYYARLSYVRFDSQEPFQHLLEKESLLK